MSEIYKCGLCNRGPIEKTGKYFYAIFNKDYGPDNFEKWLCQSCLELEEHKYNRQSEKIVQRGSEEWGMISRRAYYNWNTRKWTDNKNEDLGNPPNDRERERERERAKMTNRNSSIPLWI